ncbi:hypothetical protein FRC05_002125 [Tulasnella sp. 425]|nr:hypothetical protein FRC05_002125 [Tulasnella sp. 425]
METYKGSIDAALASLRKLTSKKPKLKNAVSSIAMSLEKLFKLTPSDKVSEVSLVQLSITKAFNVHIIPIYEAHPRDALELAASLINAVYNTHLSAYLTPDSPGRDGQLSWERVVDLGVLEGLSEYVQNTHSDRKLIGEKLYPVLCPMLYQERAMSLRANFRGQICSLLTDSATNHKANKARLLDEKILGAPRSSAPLLRNAYLKELFHNPATLETFGPKAAQRLNQIISDAEESEIPRIFASLYQTMGAANDRKPQGFQISTLRSIGRFIDLPQDQSVAYIDQSSIFIPVPNESGDGAIVSMEVPLSSIRQLRLLQSQAKKPMIQVILSLSELPIVSGEVIVAKIPPPHVVRFDIRKDDLPKLHMVIRSRSLATRMQDLVPTPNEKILHRVVTSVTPISMTHVNKAEKCGEDIRSLFLSHSSVKETHALPSLSTPTSNSPRLQFQDPPFDTKQNNAMLSRNAAAGHGVQGNVGMKILVSPGYSNSEPKWPPALPCPSKSAQVPTLESPSSVRGFIAELSPRPSPLSGAQQLPPKPVAEDASPEPQRLPAQKQVAGHKSSEFAMIQERVPEEAVSPSSPIAEHIKEIGKLSSKPASDAQPAHEPVRPPSVRSSRTATLRRPPRRRDVLVSETQPLLKQRSKGASPDEELPVKRRTSRRNTPPHKFLSDVIGNRSPPSPEAHPTALEDVSQAKATLSDNAQQELEVSLKCPGLLAKPRPEPMMDLLLPSPGVQQTNNNVAGDLWSFDVMAKLSSPKGVTTGEAHNIAGKRLRSTCISLDHANPSAEIAGPPSSTKVNPQVKHVSLAEDVAPASKAPLDSARKRDHTTLEIPTFTMPGKYSLLQDQPMKFDSVRDITPFPDADAMYQRRPRALKLISHAAATSKGAPSVGAVKQQSEFHSSQDDCQPILEVLGKIQTDIAEGLGRKFQGVRLEVRMARDSVLQQARTDLEDIQEQNVTGQEYLSNVADELRVQRSELRQRYIAVMKRDISTAVAIKKIVREHDCCVASSSNSNSASLFGGKGPLLLKMGFDIPR